MITEIDDLDCDQLENIARMAVVAGGFAAMGYYRGALANASVLIEGKNPSIEADIQATLAIMRSLEQSMKSLADKFNFNYYYFAEDISKDLSGFGTDQEDLLTQLGVVSPRIKINNEEFRKCLEKNIVILLDGLDGTTNFMAGIPLFCSGVAIFIDGKPLIGSIYDMQHNVVYYGSIGVINGNCCGNISDAFQGSKIGKSKNAAWMWDVQSGNNSKLPLIHNQQQMGKKLIGYHLTRRDPDKRNYLISKIKNLSAIFDGTYMLNSGLLALAYVACGNLSAFINNNTHIWDVAAGDVLVRAAGGKVTNFEGDPLSYNGNGEIDIVAAANEEIHKEIIDALGD